MKRTILTLYVCVFALMAQPTPQGPPVTELKAAITLTDSQVQQLVQLRQDERAATQTIFQQMADKQQALKTLLDANTTDAAAVGKIVLETQALRKQISDTHTRYQAQAVQLLTADQKTKLKTLEDALKLQLPAQQAVGLNLLTPPTPPAGGPGGPGGPGGFAGPGGPGPMGRGQGPAMFFRPR